ncbi:MAG: hypothetical protein HS117_18675 [Verrucomicrobiaceae bacterium]|nr:hypothetical protein [Verrucomicrobiaceae bacterium]
MKTTRLAVHPRAARAFIRSGCLLPIIALVLLWSGGQMIFTAVKNRAPHETTVAEFVAKKPDVEWITFKNATLNLLECAHMERLGNITEVFIPVRGGEEPGGAPVHILMATKDKEIIAAVKDITNSSTSEKAVIEAAARNASKIFMKRDVSGIVRFGIEADSKTRDKLTGLDMNLTKDFVILDEGEKPSLFVGAGLLGLGLLLGLYWIRKAAKEEPTPTPPPLPPNLPPKA